MGERKKNCERLRQNRNQKKERSCNKGEVRICTEGNSEKSPKDDGKKKEREEEEGEEEGEEEEEEGKRTRKRKRGDDKKYWTCLHSNGRMP